MPQPARDTGHTIRTTKKAPDHAGGLFNIDAEPAYSVTALSIAMLTPGPMVELSATFFM